MTSYFNGEFYFNVALHAILLFTFLNLFFKLYISKLGTTTINNELISAINNINTKNLVLPDIVKSNIPYYEKIFSLPHKNREIINQNVFNKLTHVVVLLFIMLILFTIILYTTGNITGNQILHVIGENILTFMCIGIVEYLFFTRIAFKYLPIMPSFLNTLLLDDLKRNFN
jgi:hypothetical protein